MDPLDEGALEGSAIVAYRAPAGSARHIAEHCQRPAIMVGTLSGEPRHILLAAAVTRMPSRCASWRKTRRSRRSG
jgi:hypothetical protein